jgi:hypothetical protein
VTAAIEPPSKRSKLADKEEEKKVGSQVLISSSNKKLGGTKGGNEETESESSEEIQIIGESLNQKTKTPGFSTTTSLIAVKQELETVPKQR